VDVVVGIQICAAARSQTQIMQSIATHFTDPTVLKRYKMQSVCDEMTVAVTKGPDNVFMHNKVLCCSLQCLLLLYKVIFL